MTILDTVTYENLIPGFTYVLEGYLMDKPRDDAKGYGKIKDKDGNYITNRKEFTLDKPNGTVQLSLSGNAAEFQTVLRSIRISKMRGRRCTSLRSKRSRR